MTAPRKTTRDHRTLGRLLVIGGAEDPDENNLCILPHLVKMAGGKNSRILICAAPSGEPDRVERIYQKLFSRAGAGEVFEAEIRDRNAADAPDLEEQVNRATAVFFTGGDQLRLTSLVAGTRFGERVRERLWEEGLTVAGTSAGAAAMSSTMLIAGSSAGTVRRSDITLAPGLGYWRDTTIDTHFSQRGRVSRLLTIFAQNPQVLGIGIDENTAIEVQPGVKFTVLGENAVYVFNGRVTHSNAADAGDDDVLAVTDSLVHALPEGYGFDLQNKRPILPSGEPIPAHL